MKVHVMFLIFTTGIILLGTNITTSYAQTNPNLYVSAENSSFENHFAGPMVIEVIIDDSDISGLTGVVQEPIVTIDNNKLSMIQSDNGKWYGYFADKTQLQKADSLVGLAGYGLDFGEMCKNDSTIAGVSLLETSGFVIPRDTSSSSNGQEAFVTCTEEVSSSNQLVNNVIRESPSLNMQSNSTAQIGIDEDVWPLIQLFDISQGNEVMVKYEKSTGVQSVELTFDTVKQFVTTTQTKTFYHPGEDIKIDISDIMLNIDPTDEDSWTWASISGSEGLYYQLFNEDGEIEADGTDGAVNIQDGQNLSDMMFDENGSLILNPNSQEATNTVVILKDNEQTVLIDKYTSDASIDLGTETISHSNYPITFTEIGSNSGTFVNYDTNGTANLIINPEAESGRSAVIEYNDKSSTIVAKIGTPPIAQDYSKKTIKDTPITFAVIDDNTETDGDTLHVTISNSHNLDGFATVNSDNTITFTPDSGFSDTTSFEYTIDDIFDGKDTGIVTITLDSAAILASISGITVYSDAPTYKVGDTINTDWIIPNDSSGTETIIKIITPIGTTIISDTVNQNTEYTANTDNFGEGIYTVRVEHGQYYGEKEISFTSPIESQPTEAPSTEAPSTEEVSNTTENTSESCTDENKISTHTKDTSYTKGEKISISTELCDIVSNEYIITQILDPFNTQVTIDQFLPGAINFDKQYSTEGKLWKIEGEYTIKSTYLSNSIKSTFNFIINSEEVSTIEKIETIASFVDDDKDPQHYIDRYNNEESYREWFDTNYSQYDSIYHAVGVDESTIIEDKNKEVNELPTPENTLKIKTAAELEKPTCGTGTELVNGVCQAVTYEKPTCGTGTELVNGVCQAVTYEKPTCGTGTELVNGVCQAVTYEKQSQKESIFENVMGFFKSLLK